MIQNRKKLISEIRRLVQESRDALIRAVCEVEVPCRAFDRVEIQVSPREIHRRRKADENSAACNARPRLEY
jgi:hypothetical protein